MGEFVLFLAVIFLLGAGAAYLAVWTKRNHRPDIMKKLMWGFWIFLSCFNFPLWSERFPLELDDVITFVSFYGLFAAGLHELYGEDQGPVLFPRMVLFSVIGMVCRYFVEFGEVSNTYNFTLFNIVVYLLAVPLYTLLVYEFVDRRKKKEE